MDSVVPASQNSPVVVGVDGSRARTAIVDLAVAEAVRRGAPLLIVHAWPGRYSGPLRPRGLVATEEDGRHLLDVTVRRVQHLAPQLRVRTELSSGSAAHVLAEHSHQARLVVVGHRDATFTRSSWGSTAAYLAHHGACPLLVHRGGVADRGPVVVAVSTAEPVTATIACAYEEAALSGSRLVAVHVWTRPTGRDPAPVGVTAGYAAGRREAERHLAEALAGWRSIYPDVEVERLVLHDLDVAYTLQRASRRGRVLVAGMGSNGRLAEMLYGSIGLAMVRQAECPVLLVPAAFRHPSLATLPAEASTTER